MALENPLEQLDFVELHDAYTSSEIQTYEDLGLCRYGEGGNFVEEGHPFLPGIDYGLKLKKRGTLPVNPSGGLLACGHPVGATGLLQAVFAFWQLQGKMKKHLGNDRLQVKNAKRGLIHSHAGTGTYITVAVASEKMAEELCDAPVKIMGIGSGTDSMRMADRPYGKVILLPHEKKEEYKNLKYPGVHSFRAGRMAAKLAYKMAGLENPLEQLDFVELHDAYTSSEIQTYEDLGLCRYGEGGNFVEEGHPFLPGIDYGLKLKKRGTLPVNPSGGLLACGHPVGATGLLQAVFAFWQLQGKMKKHLGNDRLQVQNAKRGLIHSHAGTGTYITVSILEKP